jgi:hypothetical protein
VQGRHRPDNPRPCPHAKIRASDRSASERFYDVVLPVVGLEKSYSGEHFAEWGDHSLVQATADSPVTEAAAHRVLRTFT